jgi:hypothetical protein
VLFDDRGRIKTVAATMHELDSPQSLRLGCVLGFCRVFAESLAGVVCLGSAESSPSLQFQPHPGFLFTIKPCVATGDNVLLEIGA